MEIADLSPDQLELYAYRKLTIVDNTLDDARLESRCPLDNGRHRGQPRHSVGQLDMLPPEIVTEILLALDLPTLTTFRRVNCRAMSLVDSLRQYDMVFKHCPDVLRAIISINAKHFDCKTLYQALSTSKCEYCDRIGGYLYLITCKRVCYFCFTSLDQDHNHFPMLTADAIKHMGLPKKKLEHLPHVRSLPGRYTAFRHKSKSRITLFDRQAVLKEALKTSTRSTAGGLQQLSEFSDRRVHPPDRKTREPRRYMSIISAPFFGSSGQSVDWGFYCKRCRDKEPGVRFRNKYTKDGILDHIRGHGIIT
ncbi:hypothetical protein Hte_002701 [Hypoxylon texense]